MDKREIQFWVGTIVSIVTVAVLILQTRSMLREEARLKELESESPAV